MVCRNLLLGLVFLLSFASILHPVFAQLDVYGVRVYGNQITGNIKNLGDNSILFNWSLFINGNSIKEDELILNPNETKRIEMIYYFSPGEYNVTLSAAEDSESIRYVLLRELSCQDPYGFEGDEQCRSDGLYRCSSGSWQKIPLSNEDFCGLCGCPESNQTNVSGATGCMIAISSINWLTTVKEGLPAEIDIKVLNLGQQTGINMSMYVDGMFNQSAYAMLNDEINHKFSVALQPGQHSIKIVVRADCGSNDSFSFNLTVQQATTWVQNVEQPQPEQTQRFTNASISPTSLDASLMHAKPILLTLTTSKPQYFTLSVQANKSNISVSYPEKVWVDDEKKVYMYVVPEEKGTYELNIKVAAEEKKEFNFKVIVYAGEIPAQNMSLIEKVILRIKEINTFLQSKTELSMILIALLFVGVIITGAGILREEKIWS
ncbi:MAG: hypothetical protein QXP39_03255 [Candidatus Aenigmatarchaeota archaeon]